MITGLNHITLAVSDLSRSISFYQDVLECQLVSVQSTGAYFSVGGLWLCLSLDSAARSQKRGDYTHIAFTVPEERFMDFEARLADKLVPIWKENRSEGESVYFLDPDGHKLEAHVGTLETRLTSMRSQQERGLDYSACGVQ